MSVKDKLIITKSSNVYEDCYKTLKVSPKTHEKVKRLADETNRQINEIADKLVNFALERVEVKEEK